MAMKSINAEMFAKMFLAGAKNLESKKEWINELNVFPVPDGDTGTNMKMTIEAGAHEISEFEEKFPFKIGDSVSYHTLGEICSVGEIIHMDWNDVDNIVLYVTTNGHVLPANALRPPIK